VEASVNPVMNEQPSGLHLMKTTMNAQWRTRAFGLMMLAALALTQPYLNAAHAADQSTQNAADTQSGQASQANDGSEYVAGWTVMGEICEVKYPQMKPAIDEFWTKRWNKETRERVANMKKSANFKAKLEKHRKNLNARKDEILAQCDRLFMGGAH
jgi:hypothetical protein